MQQRGTDKPASEHLQFLFWVIISEGTESRVRELKFLAQMSQAPPRHFLALDFAH